MSNTHRKIYKECAEIMAVSALLIAAETLLTNIMLAYTSETLGSFTDAVFSLDFNFGVENLWRLLVCVLISVFIIPLFGLFGNIVMFKRSLVHDRVLIKRFLTKKYQNAMELNAGDVEYRLENDPISFRYLWVTLTAKYIAVPISLCYMIVSSIDISPLYLGVIFVLAGIKIVVPIALKKRLKVYDEQTREFNTEFREFESNIVQKPYLVKIFALKTPFINRLNEMFKGYFMKSGIKNIYAKRLTEEGTSIIGSLCMAIAILFGTLLISEGKISAGSIVMMVSYYTIVGQILGDIGDVIRDTPIIKNIAKRLEWFYIDAENESGIELNNFSRITASNLSYSFNDTPIIKNMNFDIICNNKIAICGENGSGKTTLVKILCGLIDDYKGSLKIDGIELNQVSTASLRNLIAYVPQNPYLFRTTVKENIRLGGCVTDMKIEGIMNSLGISYLSDREITSSQEELSGGERQRISIAKALVQKAKILIMDEPGNNLDREGLLWLKEFINSYDEPILYISHDPLLLELANEIIEC